MGDYITYADFFLHHYYKNLKDCFISIGAPVDFEKYPNINRVVEHFRNHENVRDVVAETDKTPFYPTSKTDLKW